MSDAETKEWRGSVCMGITTSRWPFGKLKVNRDRIEIKSFLGQVILPKEGVRSVVRSGFFPWLGMGVRICGAPDGDIRFCPFPPWKRHDVLNHLKSLGYQVP